MARTDNSLFSLFSFEAAIIDQSDPTVGQFIRVFADKSSGAFQLLTFDLTENPGFHTFVLPSTWTHLARVRFSGRLFAQMVLRASRPLITSMFEPDRYLRPFCSWALAPSGCSGRRERGVRGLFASTESTRGMCPHSDKHLHASCVRNAPLRRSDRGNAGCAGVRAPR